MDIETGSVDTLFEKPRVDVHRGLGKTVRGGVVKYKNFVPGFNPLVAKLFYGTASSKVSLLRTLNICDKEFWTFFPRLFLK